MHVLHKLINAHLIVFAESYNRLIDNNSNKISYHMRKIYGNLACTFLGLLLVFSREYLHCSGQLKLNDNNYKNYIKHDLIIIFYNQKKYFKLAKWCQVSNQFNIETSMYVLNRPTPVNVRHGGRKY